MQLNPFSTEERNQDTVCNFVWICLKLKVLHPARMQLASSYNPLYQFTFGTCGETTDLILCILLQDIVDPVSYQVLKYPRMIWWHMSTLHEKSTNAREQSISIICWDSIGHERGNSDENWWWKHGWPYGQKHSGSLYKSFQKHVIVHWNPILYLIMILCLSPYMCSWTSPT